MTEIDWNKLAEEADNSPGAIYARLAPVVEDVKYLLIVVQLKNNDFRILTKPIDLSIALGLLSRAQFVCFDQAEDSNDDEDDP